MTVPQFTTSTATAAALNVLVDTVNSLYGLLVDRVGFRVRRVANQAIGTGGAVAISWDTEDEDSDGFITVPSTTATIPTGCAGIYVATVRQILSATPGAGRALLEINVTSSLTGLTTDYRVGSLDSNESGRMVCTAVIPFAVGDSFFCNTLQSSGGSLNLTGILSCYRVSV